MTTAAQSWKLAAGTLELEAKNLRRENEYLRELADIAARHIEACYKYNDSPAAAVRSDTLRRELEHKLEGMKDAS